jgi:hypothetical protein
VSDDFEAISVAETESPVVASGKEAAAPAEGQSYSPEAMPAEIEATQINLEPADNVLTNNAQQAYNETYAPDRVNDSAPLITAKAIADKEDEKEAKRSEAFEQYQEQEKQAERRRELAENFGMSSKDLTKLLDFISNPELQEKLKDKLVKNGMSKERAEKTLEKMSELKTLKEKQDSGQTLTDEEKARLAALRKDEDLKVAIQAAQEFQGQRSEMAVDTGGAKVNVAAAQIAESGLGAKGKELSVQQKASFESVSDSGIKAEAITSQYNMVAAANKNEQKAPEMTVAQNNIAQVKAVDVGMASLTV